MARIDLNAVTQWLTTAALQHGADDLPAVVMQRLSISRRAALALLTRMVGLHWLVRDGSARRQRYRPGALRQVVQRYPLSGLQEDLPWQRDFAPAFDLPKPVARMAQHAFCELLNNAVDHSGGTSVTVSMRQAGLQLQLLVSDDGCGIFGRIEQAFDIADPQLAMLELSKGKLTSAPQRHAGHGLYFTARLADVFDLHANAHAFQLRSWEPGRWRAGRRPLPRQGSSVYLAIVLDTDRTLDAVLCAHSSSGAGYGFDRTRVPLQLLTAASTGLESRAQARRVTARLHDFEHAEIDFSGVDAIGHGFADELFRVYSGSHPGVALVPVGMAPRVAAVIAAVLDRPAAPASAGIGPPSAVSRPGRP